MKIPNQLIYPQGVQKHQHLGSFNYCIFKILFLYLHKRKINIIINRPRTGSQNLFLMTTINEISNHIMGYFDGTLDAFGYTAQSVNEISNPDESYMGTLNLQFREFIQDDEQDEDMISQYTNIYNAIEKWESDHRETEIFQQLAVSELFNQLNK